jgi:hypothetical protein
VSLSPRVPWGTGEVGYERRDFPLGAVGWGGADSGDGGTCWDTALSDSLVPIGQVILGEIFSDYTPAQVVVKELRASAGPLEQRKFISEAQPYRCLGGRGCWGPNTRFPSDVTFGSGRSPVLSQTWLQIPDPPLPGCVTLARRFFLLELWVGSGTQLGTCNLMGVRGVAMLS